MLNMMQKLFPCRSLFPKYFAWRTERYTVYLLESTGMLCVVIFVLKRSICLSRKHLLYCMFNVLNLTLLVVKTLSLHLSLRSVNFCIHFVHAYTCSLRNLIKVLSFTVYHKIFLTRRIMIFYNWPQLSLKDGPSHIQVLYLFFSCAFCFKYLSPRFCYSYHEKKKHW